ncbi:MAG: hypothetical protein LBQ28_01575 [Prevotellaceae bacterium]|jgi:hypothetical protein|nr:hypothetical protein [Prevotellaceae bacterium]
MNHEKKYLILLIYCVFIQSCADLNKVHYFKASSDKWQRYSKKLHISIFDDHFPDRCDYFSYTYNGENKKTVVYPLVQNIELLWGPIVIPFIPGPSLFSTSGKYRDFEMKVEQNCTIPPDNIVCIIDGKEVYPYIIHIGLRNNKDGRVSERCFWQSDSTTNESPYKPAKNWGNFMFPNDYIKNRINDLYADTIYSNEDRKFLINSNKDYIITDTTASVFYTYKYHIRHSGIEEIQIYFKDNSAPPLLLKRKKGLQYALTPFLIYR